MESLATRPDLVWAKFTDYPWWPAFLTGAKGGGKREVIFFGIFDRSFVPEKNIRAFENKPAFAKKDAKNVALKASIAAAEAVSRGESSLEMEYLKVAGTEVPPAVLDPRPPSPQKSLPKTPLKPRKQSKCLASISTIQESPQSPLDCPSPRFSSKSQGEKSQSLPFGSQSKTPPAEFAADPKLRFLADELRLFSPAFEQTFSEFSRLVRRFLTEKPTDELLFSGVGPLLSEIGRSLEAEQHLDSVARRLPEFRQLLQAAKTEVINRFFGNSSQLSTDSSAQKKAESCPSGKAWSLKIDRMIQNRVEKKLAKVLRQGCRDLASKNEYQNLAKVTQFALQKTAKNLLEYKGKVVTLVAKRREEFVKAACEMLARGENSDRWHLAIEGLAV